MQKCISKTKTVILWTLKPWGLSELMSLIKTEIKARANCGEYIFSQGNESDHLDLRSTSSLKSQTSKSISNKFVFCLGQHWSDKCDVITDTETRKSYLKNHKRCFNCLTLIWVGGTFTPTPPPCWFSVNNSETVKVVTLTFRSIQ